MGDIADMMLDGDLCMECGCYMEGGDGYARRCPSCSGGRSGRMNKGRNAAKVNCPDCGRRVKAVGLAQHRRDAHGVAEAR